MPQPQRAEQIKDLQQYPFVLVPKAFFARKPSANAILAYIGIKYFASSKTGKPGFASVPTMAKLVDLSVRSFQRATAELVKKNLLKVRRRRQKTPGGKALFLPNVYELLNLEPPSEDKRRI